MTARAVLSAPGGTMGLSMDDGVHRLTVLDLSYACLQVVQSQVADLVFETIEIHCDGFV